ncbi:MAG: hypothetical protein RMJ98_03140 [Myxococcales bacterium]|nr:hypothetical protein [Polyangiaceae bacterium]MDW8248285.1 hypothetical protein [Myxococcales bacterium]
MPRPSALLAHFAGPASLTLAATLISFAAVGPGCGGGNENEYKPKPAYSGRPVKLPDVPNLSNKPKKNGEVYTVAGLIHDFRSRVHSEKLLEQESITVSGYIVKTNLHEAPPCAVHKTGKKDGPECEKNPPPIPAFWIADEKNAPEHLSIPVMGWAGNYADIYDAVQAYKRPNVKELVKNKWGSEVPNPIPNKDAKVTVVGKYSSTFTLASQGVEANPVTGIITYKSLKYDEPPPTPGTLPGLKLPSPSPSYLSILTSLRQLLETEKPLTLPRRSAAQIAYGASRQEQNLHIRRTGTGASIHIGAGAQGGGQADAGTSGRKRFIAP